MLIPFTDRGFGAKTVSVKGNNIEHGLKKRPLLLWVRKFCARLSDEVVANSKSLACEVKETFGLLSDVAVTYNGIDPGTYRKKPPKKRRMSGWEQMSRRYSPWEPTRSSGGKASHSFSKP